MLGPFVGSGTTSDDADRMYTGAGRLQGPFPSPPPIPSDPAPQKKFQHVQVEAQGRTLQRLQNMHVQRHGLAYNLWSQKTAMTMRRFSMVSLIVFLLACWLPVIGNAGQATTPEAAELREIENAFEEVIFRGKDRVRPLLWAAGFLERKIGVPISYEDPVWAWSVDFSPAAEHPGNAQRVKDNPDWDGGLGPRGGHIEVRLDMNRITQEVRGSPQTILERVLEDHRARGNPGQFRVLELEGGEFVITPTGAMDSEGKMLAQGSPFDTRISLRAETRNGIAAVEAICAAITAAGGAPVGALAVPPP